MEKIKVITLINNILPGGAQEVVLSISFFIEDFKKIQKIKRKNLYRLYGWGR